MIRIRVEGVKKITDNLNRIGVDLPRTMKGAGIEASNEILDEQGLRKYPPATRANFPPPPFYIRGRGMQTSASRNDGKSQRLGTKWQVVPYGLGIKIKNPVTYSVYVHGDPPAKPLARIGWKSLFQTAKEKIPQLERIYEKWIMRLLKKYGL